MPLENSPHPRAVQELRFVALSAEWHKWVTVPEFVGGVPTTREILDDAIALPPKHCMWKNCQWSGATNKERWSHIRASHWTTTLAEAVAYYSADNGEDCNLETVLGQVAGILTRKTAPFVCKAIDRRCLKALSDALAEPDAVQSLICFEVRG